MALHQVWPCICLRADWLVLLPTCVLPNLTRQQRPLGMLHILLQSIQLLLQGSVPPVGPQLAVQHCSILDLHSRNGRASRVGSGSVTTVTWRTTCDMTLMAAASDFSFLLLSFTFWCRSYFSSCLVLSSFLFSSLSRLLVECQHYVITLGRYCMPSHLQHAG